MHYVRHILLIIVSILLPCWLLMFLISHFLNTGGQISFEDIAFPCWDSCWVMDIAINVSNSQVIWINVWSTSDNNWVQLTELVKLSRVDWILHLRSPTFLSWLVECLTCSSQNLVFIIESLLRSSHSIICIQRTVSSTIEVLSFWNVFEKFCSLVDRDFLQSLCRIHLLNKHFSLVLRQPVLVDGLWFSSLIICYGHFLQ